MSCIQREEGIVSIMLVIEAAAASCANAAGQPILSFCADTFEHYDRITKVCACTICYSQFAVHALEETTQRITGKGASQAGSITGREPRFLRQTEFIRALKVMDDIGASFFGAIA